MASGERPEGHGRGETGKGMTTFASSQLSVAEVAEDDWTRSLHLCSLNPVRPLQVSNRTRPPSLQTA